MNDWQLKLNATQAERIEHYRNCAARLREIAERVVLAGLRDDLLGVADKFEALAHSVEVNRL